jgi:hypothetical protein
MKDSFDVGVLGAEQAKAPVTSRGNFRGIERDYSTGGFELGCPKN